LVNAEHPERRAMSRTQEVDELTSMEAPEQHLESLNSRGRRRSPGSSLSSQAPVGALRRTRWVPERGNLPGDLLKMLCLCVIYYVAARLSLRLALVGRQVTPIWPPTGIALVALLLFGPRLWPGVTLGALLVNAPIGPSTLAAAGIAVGNTLAPVFAVVLLRRVDFRKELERLRDVVAIVFLGALLGMVVSATVGATILMLSGAVHPESFVSTWLVWWAGDAMGVLVFAPFLLTLRGPNVHLDRPWRRRAEAVALLAGTATIAHIVIGSHLKIEFLVFPALGLTAWRLGQRGAATAALLTSGIAIWAAVNSLGIFAGQGLSEKMLTLQVFNASVALLSFVLAAVRSERLEHVAERERTQDELVRQALHDPLTGLANRTLFMDRLTQALARSNRHPGTLAVMFLDLDRFKLINDSLGHSIGDHVLMCMAERLREVLRIEDTASRFGGDEFVVLCEDVKSEEDAILIADRIALAMAQPMSMEAGSVVVTTSIGIAVANAEADTAEDLVRNADSALYRAKERGRARYELFDHRLRTRAVKRLTIENELRRAIDLGELRVYYQPLVVLDEQRVVALEALARWAHPQRGLLGPAEFIPVAEETGLIVPIGAWVLEEVCRQWGRWQEASDRAEPLTVAVNLSTHQLARPQFEDVVEGILTKTGMAPANLSLEITESVLMETSPAIHATVRALRDLGVRFAIDDFGTGYSSLVYLKAIEVDTLKVDRSFVDGLGHHHGDTEIVNAIVNLAHSLRLTAVAEGVETREQLEYLQLVGCDIAQGYYFARPAPAKALDELLNKPLVMH
jgi:diguanylate cyclase (GGDEF)-like protein